MQAYLIAGGVVFLIVVIYGWAMYAWGRSRERTRSAEQMAKDTAEVHDAVEAGRRDPVRIDDVLRPGKRPPAG